MAFSTQRAVSNGTLQVLLLSIKYIDKSEITVYVNSIETSAYTWASDTSIRLNSVVPNGQEVLIRRTTDMSKIRHQFTTGAQFKASTLDEDFQQILHISQEALEGGTVRDLFNVLNMHGYKISNLGKATADGDAVSLGQVKTESASAWTAAAEAKASAAAALLSKNTARVLQQTLAHLRLLLRPRLQQRHLLRRRPAAPPLPQGSRQCPQGNPRRRPRALLRLPLLPRHLLRILQAQPLRLPAPLPTRKTLPKLPQYVQRLRLVLLRQLQRKF